MTEAEALIMCGFIVLALVLTVSSFVLRKGFLGFAAAGAWLILCAFSLTHRGETFDIYWALFFLSAGLAIVSIFVPLSFREEAEDEDMDDDERDARQFNEDMQKEQNRYSYLHGNRGRRRRSRPRGTSLYH